MKVVKQVRLTSKDSKGNFKKDLQTAQTVRERAIVSEQSVKDSEKLYPQTGLLYVVDEEATKERDLKLNPVQVETISFDGLEVTESDLDQYAKDNGIDFGKTSTLKGKLAKIEKARK